jgi:putative FmdB family regulatory protein
MPLYEYECRACGKRTEVLQRFSDAPPTVCPSCGGELKKLPSAPAVQFKGSGWYVTDYASKKGGEAPKSGESKSAEGESGVVGHAKAADAGDKASGESTAKATPADSPKS